MNANHQSGGIFRPEILKRIIIYGLLMFALITAQCSFFANLHICPATPDLLMGAILCITLLDSRRAAAVSAIAAGVLADAIGGSGYALSPIYYLIFAAIVGILSEKVLPSFFSYLILLIPSLVIRAAYTCVCVLLTYGSMSVGYTVKDILLPETISTFIICLALYPLFKLCSVPLGTRNKFSF